MSLTVHRCRIVGGDWTFLDDEEPGAELAGFESCRHDLWGSPYVVGLGVRVLARLRDENIHCAGAELAVLKQDVELIFAHLPGVVAATGYAEDFITHRAGNILRAVRWARAHGGGVVIW